MLDISVIRERSDLVKAAMADLNADAPIDDILALILIGSPVPRTGTTSCRRRAQP